MRPSVLKRIVLLSAATLTASVLIAGCVYRPVVQELPNRQVVRVPAQALGEASSLQVVQARRAWLQQNNVVLCPGRATFYAPGVGPAREPRCRRGAFVRPLRCGPRVWRRPMPWVRPGYPHCEIPFKPVAPRLRLIRPQLPHLPVCAIKAPRPPVVVRRKVVPVAPRCAYIPARVRMPRSSPQVLERYVPAPRLCGCRRPYRGRPYLTAVDMTFITHGYGKLASSGIWVMVVNRTFTSTLVRATNWQRSELQSFNNKYFYAPRSVHTFALPFERSAFGYGFFATQRDRAHYLEKIPGRDQRVWFKSECRHLLFQVGIMARGAMLGTTGNTFGFDGKTAWSGYGGHNRWDFTAILTLHFSDGSKIIYERPYVMLDSVNGRLVLTKFR